MTGFWFDKWDEGGREKDILGNFTLDQMGSTSTMATGRRQERSLNKDKKTRYLRLKIVQRDEPLAYEILRKEEF